MQHIFMAQMQEKGRRLAQELPGFNWLEEKIRNGGVSTVLTPRRLSGTTCSSSNGGSTVDTSSTDMRAVPTSDAAAVVLSPHVSKSTLDAARSNEPPLSSSPTEYRLVHISRGPIGIMILQWIVKKFCARMLGIKSSGRNNEEAWGLF